jgi:hypothetical protein
LYLGGHKDEELDVKVDPKHAWRTGFSNLKDKMNDKIKKFNSLKLMGSKKNIENYVIILKSDAEDRVEKVFGAEHANLLQEYLKDAEERQKPDESEKPSKHRRKRSHEETLFHPPSDEEQEHARKQPRAADLATNRAHRPSPVAAFGDNFTDAANPVAADTHQTSFEQLLWRLGY